MPRRRLGPLVVLALATFVAAPASGERATSSVRAFQAARIATGDRHTCAVLSTGRVRCWGSGGDGRLGSNAAVNIGNVPGSMQAAADVPLPADATAVSAGLEHSCALLVTGRVRCWGAGSSGRLGNDSTSNIGATAGSIQAASDVPLPAAASAITAGDFHTCALLVTGRVRCWGAGGFGQLGTNATASVGATAGSMQAAADVPLPAAATAVTAGGAHTCAILTGGSVRCWGAGNSGRLGNDSSAGIGATAGSIEAAADVPLPAGATAITAADRHTCAVLDTGKVRCWGFGGEGRLGSNATSNIGDSAGSMQAAADVPLPGGAIAVSAGRQHTCALLGTGKVRCWGFGGEGRLGTNDTATVGDGGGKQIATDVPLPADAAAISAGGNHTCALLVSGKLRCWGLGSSGQLGHDATSNIGATAGSIQAAFDVPLPADLFGRVTDLSLTAVGGAAGITVTLVNAGPDATDVTVAAPVPAGLTAGPAITSRGTYAGASGVWAPGSLAPGETATLTLAASARAPGTYAGAFEVATAPVKDVDSTPGNGQPGEDDYAVAAVTAPAATPGPAATLPTATPTRRRCRVPKLRNLPLKRARAKLRKAHCKLGKIRRPKGGRGKRVVRKIAPRAGTVRPAGSRVTVTLKRRRR